MSDKPLCELCGEPMPDGEEMFKFHGYSGPCPKPIKLLSRKHDEVTAQRDKLRGALVGLVGVDTREELEQLEAAMRLMPAPAQDKAATIDAIHALLATLGEPPSPAAVDPHADSTGTPTPRENTSS